MQPLDAAQVPHAMAEWPSDVRVVVDFDETLFNASSTLLFLDAVRPRWFAWVVHKLGGLLCRFLPPHWGVSRDAVVVWVLWRCCPGSRREWVQAAAECAARYANRTLVQSLVARFQPSQVVVGSFGLAPVIRPLLDAVWAQAGRNAGLDDERLKAWKAVPLVATDGQQTAHQRARGKLALLNEAGFSVGPGWAVITDSRDDQDVMDAVSWPLYVKWPTAQTVHVFERLYLPLRYVQRYRHKSLNFFFKVMVIQEWLGLYLVYGPVLWRRPDPVWAGLGVMALLIAFWLIYEQGYAENDRVAVALEGKQVEPHEQARFRQAHHSGEPWAWGLAALLSAGGVLAIRGTEWGVVDLLGVWVAWMLTLLGMRWTYWAYNRLVPEPRVWLYPWLQIWKYVPLALLVPMGLPGVVFVVAYTVSRWFPYWIYRCGGNRSGFPELALRLVLLLMGLGLMAPWIDRTPDTLVQVGLLVAYSVYRSRHEWRGVFRQFAWMQAPPRP